MLNPAGGSFPPACFFSLRCTAPAPSATLSRNVLPAPPSRYLLWYWLHRGAHARLHWHGHSSPFRHPWRLGRRRAGGVVTMQRRGALCHKLLCVTSRGPVLGDGPRACVGLWEQPNVWAAVNAVRGAELFGMACGHDSDIPPLVGVGLGWCHGRCRAPTPPRRGRVPLTLVPLPRACE